MTYEQLLHILQRAHPSDWLHQDKLGIYIYRYDVDIRVERQPPLPDDEDYTESWACQFTDSKPKKIHYHLYYNQSLIEPFTLVEVDNGKAQVPLPHHHIKLVIGIKDYALARIVDTQNSLDDYLQKCGIKIVSEPGIADWE